MYLPPDQLVIEGRAGIASRWTEAFFVKELRNLIRRRRKSNFFHFREEELVHRANICGERVVNNYSSGQRPGIDFIGPFRLFTGCSPGAFGG
jgi:hypothetical protein